VESAHRETETQRDLRDRLRKVEGQVRGIQRMVEERRPWEDIIPQLLAARTALDKLSAAEQAWPSPVPLEPFAFPAVINVGLETFFDSLVAQGAPAVHVDWRPPAGGDERLMGILAKMKRTGQAR